MHAGVQVGRDTVIHPFESRGQDRRRERCEIGPAARVIDSELGNEVTVFLVDAAGT